MDDDDETFATESEPWVTVHNNRRRRNIAIAGSLLVVASVVALVLGVTLYDRAGTPRSTNTNESSNNGNGGFDDGSTVVSPTASPTTSAPTQSPTASPTELSLLDFLTRESLGDGSELLDPDSYQHQAMVWLESVDGHQALTDQQTLQKFALACIYYSTYQKRTLYTDAVYGYDSMPPTWNRTDNWLSTTVHECNWFGILCSTEANGGTRRRRRRTQATNGTSANDNEPVVTDIELYSNSLTGSFPPEVIYLKDSLIALDLYDNVIWNQGDSGHWWLEELTNVEYLFYGNTFFQYDGIPTYIGALTNLIEYDCSTTLYFGTLRGEIFANLKKLQYLVMGDNSYNMATVPTEIVTLPDLQYLYLHNCDLQGNLDFVQDFQKMQEFWIDKNAAIKGAIPTEIANLNRTLVTFSATDCSLSGNLPSEMGLLTNVRKLWLSGNGELSGRVPSELGRLKQLQVLEVQDNALIGPMPQSVCNLVVPSSTGGNLTTLIADCEMNCTCCTSCQ